VSETSFQRALPSSLRESPWCPAVLIVSLKHKLLLISLRLRLRRRLWLGCSSRCVADQLIRCHPPGILHAVTSLPRGAAAWTLGEEVTAWVAETLGLALLEGSFPISKIVEVVRRGSLTSLIRSNLDKLAIPRKVMVVRTLRAHAQGRRQR